MFRISALDVFLLFEIATGLHIVISSICNIIGAEKRDVNVNEERLANLMQQQNEQHRAQANLIQQQNEQHRANMEVLRLMKEELLEVSSSSVGQQEQEG
ncbi:hypothetical protein LguiB_012642 [Lonicera macranthoides]